MMKDELFDWIQEHMWDYPDTLGQFTEEIICGVTFLCLPVKYGTYEKIYLCLHDNPVVQELRENNNAVGIVENYETAQILILEFAKKFKSEKRRTKK